MKKVVFTSKLEETFDAIFRDKWIKEIFTVRRLGIGRKLNADLLLLLDEVVLNICLKRGIPCFSF